MEIPARKWISKSSSPVPSTYQGYLKYYWGCKGTGVWGEGPGLDPFWQGNLEKTRRWAGRMDCKANFCDEQCITNALKQYDLMA